MNNYLKSIIVVITLCIFTIGCSGNDPIECLKTVQKAYPDSEVRNIPGFNYNFIVREQDGTILYIKTMNLSDTEITDQVRIMKPSK